MTCECGAAKTYKAPPKSTLHSDWCVDSPLFKPKEVAFTFGAFGVQKVLYGLPKPTLPMPPSIKAFPCDSGCMQSGIVPTLADVKIDYSNDLRWGSFRGMTKYFCDGCSPPANRYLLINGGCTVTTL